MGSMRASTYSAWSIRSFGAQTRAPTPTQHQVNSAPHCSGRAGGMTDLMLLKGRGY